MNLYDKILAIYPALTTQDFLPGTAVIRLQNDSDGQGDYIAVWDHPTFPRPTQAQIDAAVSAELAASADNPPR